MDLNDLFVSYKQVNTPSYLSQESYLQEEPQSIIDQTNLDRIQSRKQNIEQSNEGFPGWIYPSQTEQSQTNDNTLTKNKIVNFFINKGLSKNQAKGIYGNIMQESGGKHNIVSSDGYNSYGLAQWTGPRKARLFSKYGTKPTIDQQLEFMWEELNSSEKSALNALKNTSTVEDATKVFMQKYERPAAYAANFKNRLKYAKSIA